MRSVTFTLPYVYPTLNKLMRMHFTARKRAKRRMMREIADAALADRPRDPFARAEILIERHSVGTPDIDGLYGGAKDLIDCLTTPSLQANGHVKNKFGLGFVVDDSPNHIDLQVIHVPSRLCDQRTVVTITEVVGSEVQ